MQPQKDSLLFLHDRGKGQSRQKLNVGVLENLKMLIYPIINVGATYVHCTTLAPTTP